MGMKLKFPKVSREKRETFSLAFENYKKGEYSACFQALNEIAEQGVARACYCVALLHIDRKVEQAEGFEAFLEYLKKARALKYPLAAGLLAACYFETGETAELATLCKEEKKCADGRFLTMLAAAQDGFLGEEFPENAALAQKTYALAKTALDGALALKRSEEWEENDLYLGQNGWTRRRSYAFLYRMLMLSYRYAGEYKNRDAFRDAYKKAVEYGDGDLFLFGVHKINAQTLMRDIMGLSELKAVNATMVAFKDCFFRLSEQEKEENRETYEELFSEYETYFEKESARLKSLHIHANESFERDFAGRGAVEMISDLARGVERWANTPTAKEKTYYEIEGKKYEKDSLGYLRDEQGLSSGVRVDDVGRVYDQSDRELGYFGTDGIFMPK